MRRKDDTSVKQLAAAKQRHRPEKAVLLARVSKIRITEMILKEVRIVCTCILLHLISRIKDPSR